MRFRELYFKWQLELITMKQLSLIVIITTYVVAVNAQDYRQFPKSTENPLWVIKTTYPYIEDNDDIHCSYIGMIGDTLINSKEYSKIYFLNDTIVDIYHISDYYGAALREESKKIYIIHINEQIEKLVFDFSKNINDTIIIDSSVIPPVPIILDDIDTIFLYGISYIRYLTSCGDQWIEGIGNTEWSTFDICPSLPCNGSYTRLSCFKLDNTIIYGENCKCDNSITNLTNTKNCNSIEIYPNPASDFVIVKHNNFININKIQIFDINGKVMFEKICTSNIDFIALDNFSSGIYLIKIISDDFINSNTLIIKKNKR